MASAVIALDVACEEVDLHRLMRGTACKFAPHITLLPRFPLRPKTSVETLRRRIAGTLDALFLEPVALRGPRSPEADLVWYETAPGEPGHETLHRAHERLLRQALATELIDGEPRFADARYHPHMTVGWHTRTAPAEDLPATLTVWGRAVALYRYDADPRHDAVARHGLSDGSRPGRPALDQRR